MTLGATWGSLLFIFCTMSDGKKQRSLAPWTKPSGSTFRTGLRLNNTLTRNKDEFIPQEGKTVKWYICGPTVYDDSHLGHARAYLTFDIIRRIMEDYFGYHMFICMNITDIDDKIIITSRKRHLLQNYAKKNYEITETVLKDLNVSLQAYITSEEEKLNKIKEALESGKRNAKEATPEMELRTEKITKAKAALDTIMDAKVGEKSDKYIELASGPLSDHLDGLFGKDVDQELMKELSSNHTQKYEREYLEDMKALGVKTPDVLTRVSEYIPEIIEMVQKIISNNYGYESDGSVYFDTVAFDQHEDHQYAKLQPTAVGDAGLMAEGEGALSGKLSEKKSPNDFALWKKSKPGEPAWDSPWGRGRPGWHIECSAMAGNVLGHTLDVHAGGHDLQFPHHDNELAQSEAYFGNKQWVNYFMHAGHLHIDGMKMSKSLKNFITIQEALATNSPRHIRLLFLSQPWDNVMMFQRKDTMRDVIARENHFKQFFNTVESLLLERTHKCVVESWVTRDVELNKEVQTKQNEVHEALADNFDTPKVLNLLSDLVTKAFAYLNNNDEKKAFLLKKIAIFVTKILRVFGVIEGEQEFGFPKTNANEGVNAKELLSPLVSEVCDIRAEIRALAKNKSEPDAYLKLSDLIRDVKMPKLGIKLVDDGPVPFFFEDPETLRKEREERDRTAASVKKAKLERTLEGKNKDLTRWKEYAESPVDFVKRKHGLVISEDGELPTTDAEGKELSANKKKALKKDFDKQKTNNAKYQAELAKDNFFLIKLGEDIQTIEADIAAATAAQ